MAVHGGGELAVLAKEDPGRPRIVILNYPSNPTGTTYQTGRLKLLGKVARQHRVILLSDEIYGELHYQGRHVSVARFYPEGTIISSGLSKWCGAGGWRLGTFTFPPSLNWLLEAMAAVASETYTSTSTPVQYSAVRAFRGGATSRITFGTHAAFSEHWAGKLHGGFDKQVFTSGYRGAPSTCSWTSPP
jgi:aspartate aminotransferase